MCGLRIRGCEAEDLARVRSFCPQDRIPNDAPQTSFTCCVQLKSVMVLLSGGGFIMRYILAILFFAVFVEGATAADIPQTAPYTRAPVEVLPASYNWSGFYVGAMGGAGWSDSQGVDFKGGFAGGTLGGNAQFSNFVLGGEIEGAWSNIGQTASTLFGLVSAADQIQAFGSATVRAG